MAQRFVAALQHANVNVHETEVWNWSATHSSGSNAVVLAPENVDALKKTLQYLNEQKLRFRILGSGNSPNGNFLDRVMLSMEHLDRIEVRDDQTVKAEAGATICQILDALGENNFTLKNFSSITSQQAGGWTQVAAHGTGARLPTVDEMVEELALMTPSGLNLAMKADHPWFHFAKVGLGYLGVVTAVVLRTMPKVYLHEKAEVLSHAAVRQGHLDRLSRYRHVRYMWIPLTKYCVVVTSNPCERPLDNVISVEGDLSPLRALDTSGDASNNFATVRETVLRQNVLDIDHVRRLNEAEVEFWKTVNSRVGPTNDLLGFECGGQQLVLETCFKVNLPLQDVDFVLDLLQRIEDELIPAPGPIEQRWTAGSAGALSPSHGHPDDLFSWVGIIMYLCDDAKNAEIKREFSHYAQVYSELGRQHAIVPHWAKLDVGINWKPFLWQRYGRLLDEFDKIRGACDPHNLLGVAPWRFSPKENSQDVWS
eukprot:GEMP01033722.1.p1 GENE.GEMP01033722.1~~GEMP01033722.1.p1  ORF type:complete len:481 (-),score=90.59 GEMP01033722.1:628-2070(-)